MENNKKIARAIIVDDEPKLREVLSIKIKNFLPQLELIGQAENVPQAYEMINQLKPDLIFLDISMPVESGFDLIEKFDEFTFEIIFVTGHNEYALDALKISAIDYLLKPVATQELKGAVEKALKRIKERTIVNKYKLLQQNIINRGTQETKISIPGSKVYDFVKIGDIIYCEGWQKYSKIHLKNGEVIVSSYNLGVFKNLLAEYNFYLTHKSYLINCLHIKKYHKEGIVELIEGHKVPVARRTKEDFIDRFVKN